MSSVSGNAKALKNDFSHERKISFKGLEKCLEAFTTGEGKVVRKYARLFSQLSGTQQDDEEGAISWSSSDDDNPAASSQNISIVRRSRFTRKLNSQIDFETRIRSKEHGRRLTRAHFTRSVDRFSQEPFNGSSERACRAKEATHVPHPAPELCLSILDKSFLGEISQISFSEESKGKEALESELPLALTPRTENPGNNGNTVSPVFKLKPKRTAQRGQNKYKNRDITEQSLEDQSCAGPAVRSSFSEDYNVNDKCFSPEVKKSAVAENEENILRSPILESRVIRSPRTRKKSPMPGDSNISSGSPIVRKSARIRRQRAHIPQQRPASPVLEPKPKSVAFKRKRRKLANNDDTLLKNTSQSCSLIEELNPSRSPIFGCGPMERIRSPPVSDATKLAVKRSLHFDLKNCGKGTMDKGDCASTSHEMKEPTDLPVKSGSVELSPLQTSSAQARQTLETKSKCLTKSVDAAPVTKKPSLNETNVIEEVFTEELEPPKSPQLAGRRKKILSLRKNADANSNKRKCPEDDLACQDIIEENSETQAFIVPRTPNKNVKTVHQVAIHLNRTVFKDADFETQNVAVPKSKADKTEVENNSSENQDFVTRKLHETFLIDEDSQSQDIARTLLPAIRSPVTLDNDNDWQAEIRISPPEKQHSVTEETRTKSNKLSLKSVQQASVETCNSLKELKEARSSQKDDVADSSRRKCSEDDLGCQDIIEEYSETQAFIVPRTPNKNLNTAHQGSTNLNRTVFINADFETQNVAIPKSKADITEVEDKSETQDFVNRKLHGTLLIEEESQSQNVASSLPSAVRSPGTPDEHDDRRKEIRISPCEKQHSVTEETTTKSKLSLKSVQQTSEIRDGLRPGPVIKKNSHLFKLPWIAPRTPDEELVISQSSTRSENGNNPHLNSNRTGSSVIESVSSQASRDGQHTDKTTNGDALKPPANTRSPVVSSPMVISSVGSSPEVRRGTDFPFVVIEDEYNAPPKRRSKKLDPNGIGARLQRLLNQRRSSARIWQFKRSKLNRLNDTTEGKREEHSRGRVLTVLSVWVESSHVVLSTKENKGLVSGELQPGKEFRINVLVVLDPGVVFRLGKIMTASSIEIFPPWQAMDLADRNTTVILGANIVEVLSTDPLSSRPPENEQESATVQKYVCQCVPPLPDAIALDCWDGAQTIGLLDILYPREAPACSQLLHCDDSILERDPCLDAKSVLLKQHKYSIQEMLSTHGTISHGKGHLVLSVLRVLCFWQRSGEMSNRRNLLPHWSIIGEDDLKEICEVVFGEVSSSEDSERLAWTDFFKGKALGRTYKFRGLAVSQRLDRSRYCGEWTVIPENQKIVYVLVPSSQFSFTIENSASHRRAWEPEVTSLSKLINKECSSNERGFTAPTRVSIVCRVFHANEHYLYVGDYSISPQLCSVVLRPSVFVPSNIFVAVRKPKPTKLLVVLQDVEVSKGTLTADRLSRILALDEKGYAYEENSFRRNWPASQEVYKAVSSARAMLPLFCPDSCARSLVLLTGSVCGLDESSALIWPACGTCGSPVNTEENPSQNAPHFCEECKNVTQQLVVHMSLIVFVSCAGFPEDTSIRVKLSQNTIQVLLRAMPKEGQDYTVREALGKPIGPIRCEVTSAHNGNFVLQELPTSLWK